MRRLIVTALLLIPGVSFAQASARTVSPGMTRNQVVAALGEPATARTASEYTYLFYPNACGRACGMNDLVILRGDSVVDAIFRSPDRHYTGVSSSPTPILAQTSTQPKKRKAPAVHKDAAESASKTAAAANKPKAAEKPAAAASKAPDKPAKADEKATPAKRMNPPKEANDVRPSIPANPPTMKPAPNNAPAPAKKSTSPPSVKPS